MDPFAYPEDIESVFRPLTDAEINLATGLIQQATMKLRLAARRRHIDLDLLWADPLTAEAITAALVNAAKRVLMNPEGIRQLSETTGPMTESRTIDAAISSGLLYLDNTDLADIFPATRPKSIRSFRVRSGLV